VLTHVEPQSIVPLGHVQLPAEHTFPPLQATPQPPQLLLSVCVFTHAPPQFVVPPIHVVEHVPLMHTWPVVHAIVQLPQCIASVAVLMQVPLQSVVPLGHAHAPPPQL
jgi:hypothetical protein